MMKLDKLCNTFEPQVYNGNDGMHAADCVHRLIHMYCFPNTIFCQLIGDIDKNHKMSKEESNYGQ